MAIDCCQGTSLPCQTKQGLPSSSSRVKSSCRRTYSSSTAPFAADSNICTLPVSGLRIWRMYSPSERARNVAPLGP